MPDTTILPTPYQLAWQAYKQTKGYKASLNQLLAKGISHPYCNNILQAAFDAGYNSK